MSVCPQVKQTDIRQAGFFNVAEPFELPQKDIFLLKGKMGASAYLGVSDKLQAEYHPLLGSWHAGEGCVWSIFLFHFPDCKQCSVQEEAVDLFLNEGFGDHSQIQFFRVVGSQSLHSTMTFDRSGLQYLFDPFDHLFEQLAVQATPSAALIDPMGLVQGFYPGLIEFNAPGFEVFSHRLAGKQESVNGWVIPLALVFVFICLVGILGYNLARWRKTMV